MGTIRQNIAYNIGFHRKRLKLSQKELAEKVGVKSLTTVSSWERGANAPDVETLFKLCDLFGISVDEMYGVKSEFDREQGSIQGVIAIMEEIYGYVGLIEGEKNGTQYSYWLVGLPPNQFVLHDFDMDTLYDMTKNAIPPLVERMKDTRPIEEIIKELIDKANNPRSQPHRRGIEQD